MNPYLNSINGFGGGFIAFWPSQGVVAAVVDRFIGYVANIGILMNR